jgi:hypothetical protein
VATYGKCNICKSEVEVKYKNGVMKGKCKVCKAIVYKRNLDKQDRIIFISHASEDKEYAYRLYDDLKKRGFNPWLDKENLVPGKDWNVQIRETIKKCKYFLPLFSSTSVLKEGYVQEEFDLAHDLGNMVEEQMSIIPIRLDECDIPEKFRKKQFQDMFQDWNEAVNKIIKVIEGS